ncbi:DUF1553 domain-containing protein [Tautonia sociabilis]|uniref:DUF1553 domain-containing protein n=1 Tax=Tautonia sociabilis TaxID=2080755 RepID=A0A432MLR1_9BACT|nr:DUF1553 domain-containing protein [Tautonia sociabilis]RUL88220.1 DUF1553 domain-containing protein [Tautonia sociabilis]
MGIRSTLGLAGILASVLSGPVPARAREEAADLEFFEARIRPVLVEHCYRCHSDEAEADGRLKGGLKLDSREGLRIGGDSGPAVVPGEVDESVLIEALRYEFLMMPPEGKLPDPVIADFEEWVARGAPDPREGATAPSPRAGIDLEAGREHWAYQPPREWPAPEVSDADWPITEIDRFILHRLEAEGLRPVPDADRVTLIRRLSFDLTGLPPTPEEIDAFVRDESPTAYEDLVDRLLCSPHFGERWGRHWLDVARFAESLTLRGFVLKEAWRYRDFVIDAFNEDMPFDQFLREQIAGDLMPGGSLEDRRRRRIATAFLVLGNTNLEEQDKEQLRMDVVDEQIEVIGKAILGQTISCARCHDHKFDPIPTADYYALAGILRNAKAMNHANVSKWIEVPLPMDPAREAAVAEHEKAVAALEARVKEARARAGGAKGVLAVAEAPGIVVDDEQAARVGDWTRSTSSGTYIGSGYLHDGNTAKGAKSLTFQPEIPEAGVYDVWLAYAPGSSRAANVPVTILSAEGESTLEVDLRPTPPIEGRYVALGRFRFEANGQGYVQLSNEGTRGHVTADAVLFLPEGKGDRPEVVGDRTGDDVEALEEELKRLRESGPKRDLAISVVEEETIEDARIHIRGSVHLLGEEVPRGFLRVATVGEPPTMPEGESGRRELADWLASEENPLTARVFVNRVWHWLFGSGIVRTVDNLGTTGASPTHPELLDTIAVRFVEQGWSVKRLVRELVRSRTYRLSSAEDPASRAIDPENLLRWRMDRRRLDAECIRDAMLVASGRLRRDLGGPTFPPELDADYGYDRESDRRSVYEPVFRNALPDLFEAFDFADPSMVVGRRDESTVAPQALFLMNHPFVMDRARETARLLLVEKADDEEDRIDRASRLVLGRPASDAERRIALEFLGESPEDLESSWALLVQAMFASIDFRYIE